MAAGRPYRRDRHLVRPLWRPTCHIVETGTSVRPLWRPTRHIVEAGTSVWPITEDVWQLEANDAQSHYLLQGDLDVAAGTYTFAFTDDYGTFEGRGTLEGEPWVWPRWSSRSTYIDGPYVGSYVLSEDQLTASGMRADKQVFSPDDHAEGTIVEVLDTVDAESWQTAVDGLGG